MDMLPYVIMALLAALIALLWTLIRRNDARYLHTISYLQHDLRALCNAAVSMGERVNRLERELRRLDQRQDELGLQQQATVDESDGRSYNQAIKMAAKGAAVDDLVEVCGLSRSEAELLVMMHRLDHMNGNG